MHKQKVFLTGGAGFIGSNIVKSLINLNYDVTVYDNFAFGSWDNLKDVLDKITVIKGDVLDYDKLFSAIQGHQIVSHHAAQLEIILGEENPYEDLSVNTVGTLNILKAAKQVGIKTVINASSACIYGQTEKACPESYLPNPNWAYGVSKLAADKYASIYRSHYGMNVFNLRYAITYGENEWYRRVMTIYLKRFLEKQPLVIFGDGEQIRDFIHVNDLVNLHNLCIKNPNKCGDYNVGFGVSITINELASMIVEVGEKIFGYSVEIIRENLQPGEKSNIVQQKIRNPSELQMMLLDITQSKRMLGWSPIIPLVKGIELQFKWLEKNMDRWRDIKYTHKNNIAFV